MEVFLLNPREEVYHSGSPESPCSNVNNLFLESQGKFLSWCIAFGAWVVRSVLRSAEKIGEAQSVRNDLHELGWELTS